MYPQTSRSKTSVHTGVLLLEHPLDCKRSDTSLFLSLFYLVCYPHAHPLNGLTTPQSRVHFLRAARASFTHGVGSQPQGHMTHYLPVVDPHPRVSVSFGCSVHPTLSFIGHRVSMLCLCLVCLKISHMKLHGPISPSHVLQCVVGVYPKASKSLPNPCICSSGISQLTATPGQRLKNILYSFSPTHSGIFPFSLVVHSIFHGLQRDPMEMFPNLLTPLLQASVSYSKDQCHSL